MARPNPLPIAKDWWRVLQHERHHTQDRLGAALTAHARQDSVIVAHRSYTQMVRLMPDGYLLAMDHRQEADGRRAWKRFGRVRKDALALHPELTPRWVKNWAKRTYEDGYVVWTKRFTPKGIRAARAVLMLRGKADD